MQRSDTSTREFARTRLKLLDELRFTPQRFGDETCWLIEAPSQSKFFRIGPAEYAFLSLLDGETTIAEAVARVATKLNDEAFSIDEAARICSWLTQNNLISQSGDLADERKPRGNPLAALNPFWLKIPLGRAERIVETLNPYFRWLHAVPIMLVACLLWIVAAGTVVAHWGAFVESSRQLFTQHGWVWLAATWCGLKCLHELAHALACRRYGGDVREMGIVFVLLAPMCYVDATSSWRFRSKWQRMHVAAAGMYVEWIIAALAVLAWRWFDSPLAANAAASVVMAAGLSTVLFNANPLMRFDGYYILSDVLEIPNLYPRGQSSLRNLARRFFLGQPSTDRPIPGWRGRVVPVYGAAAFCWRIAICLSLAACAAVMFHGLGVLLAVAGIVAWFGKPVLQTIRSVWRTLCDEPPSRWRFAATFGLTVTAGGWLLFFASWPIPQRAPGIVEYTELEVVRPRADGFVAKLHVTDGQEVAAGDLLAELANPDLTTETHELETALKQSQARREMLAAAGETAAAQSEDDTIGSLKQRLAEKRSRFDGLRVVAPISGRVMKRDLQTLVGVWLQEGDELLAIAADHRKELHVSIDQSQAAELTGRRDPRLSVRIPARPAFEASLTRINPRARTAPRHPALTAAMDGPLPVRETHATDGQSTQFEFVEPRFTATCRLSDELSSTLRAGERVWVYLPNRRRSPAAIVWQQLQNWTRKLTDAADADATRTSTR